MYILTDGKYYVMENPMKVGEYLRTSAPHMAKQLTYKQARRLIQNPGKRNSWIRGFQVLDAETGTEAKRSFTYKGNAGVYMGKDDVDLDETVIVRQIDNEARRIMNLKGWDLEELNNWINQLNILISKYDSIQSDIAHALQKYHHDKDGKKPQAHKMAKIGYLIEEVRYKREQAKQSLAYLDVMAAGIKERYTLDKLKEELNLSNFQDYKGRTEYYEKALKILEGGDSDEAV